MSKKINFSLFCVIYLVLAGCNSGTEPILLKAVPVSSGTYSPGDDYTKALLEWKDYYRRCTNEQLFPDAFYLQLQDKVYIGSINNQHAIDINKGITVLDTSNRYGNIFSLLSIKNAFNCYDTLALVANLKTSFYHELAGALNSSPGFRSLTATIDTGQMKIRITTLYTISLKLDNLVQLLDTTKDSSLIRFKKLLLIPGNVLLAQTVDIFGFIAEFPLNAKLSPTQQQQLAREVFFNLNNSRDNASLILLSNGHLRLQLNKRYSVLGKFLQFKSG